MKWRPDHTTFYMIDYWSTTSMLDKLGPWQCLFPNECWCYRSIWDLGSLMKDEGFFHLSSPKRWAISLFESLFKRRDEWRSLQGALYKEYVHSAGLIIPLFSFTNSHYHYTPLSAGASDHRILLLRILFLCSTSHAKASPPSLSTTKAEAQEVQCVVPLRTRYRSCIDFLS